jgi:hypothetical protein
MKVQSSFMFGVSLLLFLPLAYFLYDRFEFVRTAEHTIGVVERVIGENDRCGRKRRRHNCTVFTAVLRYEVKARPYSIEVSAGKARGHNQPISRSLYSKGSRERVAYDPRQPTRAYRDKLWDIWGAPLITFFIQIGTFVSSFTENRKRR